jgi:hypothetical protein
MDEILGVRAQAVLPIVGKAVFDTDVLALDEAGLLQPLPEGGS